MATTLKLRRGTTTQHATFTGALGEVTVDTDKDVVVVHDGSTAGGFPAIRAGGALGTPSSGTVTNLTGTASININGTVGATTPAAGTFTSLSDSGNLTFTGTGNRITGDFSNATVANRVMFQTSTVNGNSVVGAVPNGTSVTSVFRAFNAADPTNAGQATFGINASNAFFDSGITGTGSYLPMTFTTGGSERMRVDTSGNVGIGTSSPGAKLHVSQGNTSVGALLNGTTRGIRFGFDTTGSIIEGVDNTGVTSFQPLAVGGVDVRFTTSGTERARIDSSGNVGIGTTSPSQLLDISANGTATVLLSRYSTDASEAAYTVRKARGTASSPSIVSSGDTVVSYNFQGYDGASFLNAARIIAQIDGTPGTNDMPGRLVFSTTADGAATATERMRIDSSGNVGIGTTSPDANLTVSGAASFAAGSAAAPSIARAGDLNTGIFFPAADTIAFAEGGVESARITSNGDFLLATTTEDSPGLSNNTVAIALNSNGQFFASSTGTPGFFNRTADGTIVSFQSAGTTEGTISISGSTTSYNGGHLSRWAQMLTKPDLLKGTVMSNLDDMNVYIDADGNTVENEQLNKVKVSDVEGDANVAGVFVNWTHDDAHNVDEINMAMTGDMIIRIAQGVTVQRGDLLMSAGDGTAKPQGDDIVRSKTIAKVTSNHVTCTYEDGSYCVPCVLMAC
jgi:hypothetical protein